jgi:hyperosmotically inducible protein
MVARVVATVIVTLAMGAPAWAADRDDQQIFRDVSAQVLRYPSFTIFDNISADVDGGIVTLSGKVTMPFKRDAIASRVAKVDGVREVRNEISVLPVSQYDDELRYRIARAIYGNENFWRYGTMVNPPIHIVVEHGRVTLDGVVGSNIDRMLARALATGFGAFEVTNNLKTDAEVRESLERL